MPGDICGTSEIMRWIARELGTDTYVNIMAQYRPAGRVSRTRYPEIDRCLTHDEFQRAIKVANEAGLFRLDGRSRLRANIQ